MIKTGGNGPACLDFGIFASDEAQTAVGIDLRLDKWSGWR